MLTRYMMKKRIEELTEKLYRIANTQSYDDAYEAIKKELEALIKDTE